MSDTIYDFDIGSTIHIKASLTTEDQLIDGTNVTLSLRDPEGALHTPIVVRDSLGNYHTDIEAEVVGQWFFRWEAGDPTAAKEGTFRVRQSHVLI